MVLYENIGGRRDEVEQYLVRTYLTNKETQETQSGSNSKMANCITKNLGSGRRRLQKRSRRRAPKVPVKVVPTIEVAEREILN